MSNVSAWDTSAANNTAAPPNGAPEGWAPSSVNDVVREMMAATARWYQDTDGGLVTSGTSNAYTLTTNSSHAALAAQSFLVFRADRNNTGAATLNVDGLGAKSIRSNGAALVSGQIVEDVIYLVVYNGTDDAYDLIGSFTVDASQLATGTLPDARLSPNVPLKDAGNVFSANQTVRRTGADSILRVDYNEDVLVDVLADTSGFGQVGTVSEHNFIIVSNGTERMRFAADGTVTINSVNVTDYARLSQDNTFTGSTQTISSASNPRLDITDGDITARLIASTGSDAASLGTTSSDGLHFFTSNTERVTISATGVFAYGGIEVGYRNLPTYSSGAVGGKVQRVTSNTTLNTGQAEGTTWVIYNNSGSSVTLTQGSGLTLRLGGTTTTGNRTLLPRGFATVYAVSTTEYVVTGHVT